MRLAACAKELHYESAALQLAEDMAKKTPPKSTDEHIPSLISNSKLQQMYATMLRCRILESHMRQIVRRGSAARGKEAALVGTTIDLLPEDAIAIAGEAGIVSYIKGTSLSTIFSQLQLSASGKKKTGKASVLSSLAAQSGIATGIALTNSRQKSENITVAFLADSVEPAAQAGAFAFAVAQKLPLIYVSNQFPKDIIQAQPYGFPIIPVDGNDVVAVYRVAHECITRTRRGNGPSLIACTALPAELSSTRSQDPLRSMEKYLAPKELFTEAWKQQIIRSFEKEVKQALVAAKKASREKQKPDVFDYVFPLQ